MAAVAIFASCRLFAFSDENASPVPIPASGVTQYVDPRIGSEGLGRVFPGPSCPFGMAKPGPDCTVHSNAGWLPMPEQVDGFSQLHVSGTGGGEKYGNILMRPFAAPQHRATEDIRLGYYACTFAESGIRAEVTTAERASIYRFTFPAGSEPYLDFDLQHFLGRNPVPHAREAQQYEGSHLSHPTENVWSGWQCVSGGWNNGGPYTVYFHAVNNIAENADGSHVMLVKIGVSFVSEDKARQNLQEDIPHWRFDATLGECIAKWNALLTRVTLADDTPLRQKRMFYTALYHTMLMPVDRTRDNGLWDDYYAIWDTYRTSTPLLTILCPDRATDIARGLLDVYRHTGYMPDARSGNSNGRTQGGSNAEIVMADAMAKGLDLDYRLALEAMIKDATVAPDDDEAEGRGGLAEYNGLGYIPYGIPRAGNRTTEYSFCDWAISEVARRLGDKQTSRRYVRQSRRWQNLWRKDYVQDGVRGFIMPRSATGEWLDSVPFGHSRLYPQHFRYTPELSYEGPWYCAWWNCFMYEASSWEYSLSIPHDIPMLMRLTGGKRKFVNRLDTFFEHGYYNVANEPSFLTPCLYHWAGRPDKTSVRVEQIVNQSYDDTPTGLPGNDDSGSMSSWLAFHTIGIYPNAGHDYYLLHRPLVSGSTIHLANGKQLHVTARNSAKHDRALLNGRLLRGMRLTHAQLLGGGELIIETTDTTRVGEVPRVIPSRQTTPSEYTVTCSLHGQTRRFAVSFDKTAEGITLHWGIQRNLRWWQGSYSMTNEALLHATRLCYTQPSDGQHLTLSNDETFFIVSRDRLSYIRRHATSPATAVTIGDATYPLLHYTDEEGTCMAVVDNPDLPLIWSMTDNAVEINWKFSKNE